MVGSLVLAIAAAITPAQPAPVVQPEMLIKMTVDPMAAPKPALRYMLLPELREMTQGNPIPNYIKCILDQDMTVPQSNISPAALKQADRAARMDKPDWQILPKLKTDGISLLLPDIQKMRELSAALQARFRDEIALGRFDDAIVTAKTMFALSRHMGEHPTLIGGLVGIAIAQIAIGPLEDMLQQPGCPNLYWALTSLPAPFIAMDKGMEGERVFIHAELRDLDDKNPMTAAQLKKLISYIDGLVGNPRAERRTSKWLAEHAEDAKYMELARRRLIENGLSEDRLATFSPYQVIFLNEKLEYEILRDEASKLLALPTWEAIPRLDAIRPPKTRPLFSEFLASYHKVRRAQGRLEQRIALLRHVEALRLYAAANGGKLPTKLADVDVPLPVDPFTGKPFRYEVIDNVAHIRGTPPKGDEQNVAYNLHYEISIRQK